jgi:hypothetical protein
MFSGRENSYCSINGTCRAMHVQNLMIYLAVKSGNIILWRQALKLQDSVPQHWRPLEHSNPWWFLDRMIPSVWMFCILMEFGFLKRNLNIANKSVKERAYQSLERPSLEYSSTVWDPHQQQDKQRLERIQRRAARYSREFVLRLSRDGHSS